MRGLFHETASTNGGSQCHSVLHRNPAGGELQAPAAINDFDSLRHRFHLLAVLIVLANGLVDFLTMAGVILPSGGKFGLGQRLLVLVSNLVVAQAELLGLDQHPHGDAPVADTSVPANDARSLANDGGKSGLAVVRHENLAGDFLARLAL